MGSKLMLSSTLSELQRYMIAFVNFSDLWNWHKIKRNTWQNFLLCVLLPDGEVSHTCPF